MLVHHELGEEQARTLRRRWERGYALGRSPDDERAINRTDGSRPGDQVVTYNRAGFVFWMLRGVMGEEAMIAGLRGFVDRWRDGVETPEGLDFPLIEDMVESLRAHAPDVGRFDAFVTEWIYGTSFPQLELGEIEAGDPGADGRRVVTGSLRNVGTGGGELAVVVRVAGAAGEAGRSEGVRGDGFEDVVVRLSGSEAVEFRVEVPFEPEKVIVDPEVEVLFAGRRRAERSL